MSAVLVIDEDLGKSGADSENRSGFQRLVAEVSMNHVWSSARYRDVSLGSFM